MRKKRKIKKEKAAESNLSPAKIKRLEFAERRKQQQHRAKTASASQEFKSDDSNLIKRGIDLAPVTEKVKRRKKVRLHLKWEQKVQTVEDFFNLPVNHRKKVIKTSCCEYDRGMCARFASRCSMIEEDEDQNENEKHVCAFFHIVLKSFKQWHKRD